MKKYVFICLPVVIVYLLTAFNSTGYHHPDEHFQIIEFAGLKSGWNTGADLPWEYDAKIRPTLQPVIALLVFKVCNLFGISSPFHQSLCLRLLTGIVAFTCILFFVRNFQSVIKCDYRMAFFLLSFLLWFAPAINIRFSSETWAGLALLPALALLTKKGLSSGLYVLAGIFMGLSFEFRFQMGIVLFGVFLWLLFVKNESFVKLLWFTAGGLVVVICGSLLDSWFYGDWVMAPWNYFKSNIVDNVASHFGISPWYYYLVQIITRPTPLIGAGIFCAILLCCFVYPKNVLLWCVVPFIIVHSLIPHKELRFLFPIVNLIPAVIMLAYQYLVSVWKSKTAVVILYPVLSIVALINIGGLVMMSFKPAMYGNVEMMEYLSQRSNGMQEKTDVYTIAWSNPYSEGPWKGLTARFYLNDCIQQKDLQEVLFANGKLNLRNGDLIILMAGYEERNYVENQGLVIEHKSIPSWIEKMNVFYKAYPGFKTLLLYSKRDETSN